MTEETNPALKTDVTVVPKREIGVRRRKVRTWVIRLSLLLTILGPLIFILAGPGYKLGLWDLGTALGFLTRNIGPKFLMVSGLIALFLPWLYMNLKPSKLIFSVIIFALGALISYGFYHFFEFSYLFPLLIIALYLFYFAKVKSKGIVSYSLIGLLIPLLGLAHLGNVRKTVSSLPFIHDVTTDTQDVPMFTDSIMSERTLVEGVNTADYIGKTAPTRDADGNSGQELVSVLQIKAYPDIRPVVVSDSKDVVFGKVQAIVNQMGWAMKSADLDTGIIEATDTTFWYGFEDDVIIRLRESEGGGTLIDVRSLSRIGGSDIGKNADRIREFFKALDAA